MSGSLDSIASSSSLITGNLTEIKLNNNTSDPFLSSSFLSGPAATVFLTAPERRALLEDIGEIALALGRSLSPTSDSFPPATEEACFPASSALNMRPDSITSPLERLHLLITLWTKLEAPLRSLLNQPDSQSISAVCSLPLARSPGTPEAVHRIARTPRAALAWQHLMAKQHLIAERAAGAVQDSPIVCAFPSDFIEFTDLDQLTASIDLAELPSATAPAGQPDQTPVVTRITAVTHDTWSNRLVVTLLTHIAEEASVLCQLAGFCDLPREAVQADWLTRMAQRTRRHPCLRHCPGLSDAEKTHSFAGEHISRCAPAYRAIYQVWRTLHRPLDFDWTLSPLLTLPALEPWRLYEVWCYLQVGAALLRTGRRLMDGGSLLRCTLRGMQLTLTTGRLSRLRFTAPEVEGAASIGSTDSEAVSLYYQPLFVSANQKQGNRKIEKRKLNGTDFAFCSRSHAMQPDIALYAKERLILLDPKFKQFLQTEEAQEDIDKMHTYTDAIVMSAGSSLRITEQRQAVAAAWCLFPGISQEQKREHPASQSIYAYPSTSKASLYGSAGVGAFQLRPGQPDNASRLTAFLTALLRDL